MASPEPTAAETDAAGPEGNPALAAACQAILSRRLAASHGIGDDVARRAALLLEILPDAAVALEAAAPHLAAAERERCSQFLRGKAAELAQIREVSAQICAGAYDDAADLLLEAQP